MTRTNCSLLPADRPERSEEEEDGASHIDGTFCGFSGSERTCEVKRREVLSFQQTVTAHTDADLPDKLLSHFAVRLHLSQRISSSYWKPDALTQKSRQKAELQCQ